MNKVLQIALCVSLCLCIGLVFAGCGDKERKAVDIEAVYSAMLKDNPDYFDETTHKFKVTYADNVQALINNDDRAQLLSTYFEPMASAAYAVFDHVRGEITDKSWSKNSRNAIYNGLTDMRAALKEFNNSKVRFQNSLTSYKSGQMSTVELIDFANFAKEYKGFIDVVLELGTATADAYFVDYNKEFYTFKAKTTRKAYDLQLLLKHKAFDIAKMSISLEYGEYFSLDEGKFDKKVTVANTTQLCGYVKIINKLQSKAQFDIASTDVVKLDNFRFLIEKQGYFDAQVKIFNTALKGFNFDKLRSSREVEEVFLEGVSEQQQMYYNDVFSVAYDFVPQVVADYETMYLTF